MIDTMTEQNNENQITLNKFRKDLDMMNIKNNQFVSTMQKQIKRYDK